MYFTAGRKALICAVLLMTSCLVALLALPMTAFAEEEDLFGCDGSNLYTIDPTTGAGTLVGAMGINRCSGLAFDSSGILFAVGADPNTPLVTSLFTVDPDTGAATLVGASSPHDFGNRITDLSFRSDDTLFGYLRLRTIEAGVANGSDGLGTLNTATGAVTTVGATGVRTSGNGIAFGPTDVLYHADDADLNTLNQATGPATWVADLTWPALPQECEVPRINAMDFNSAGVLFGSLNCGFGGAEGSGPNFLATINTTNGYVTNIGATVDGLDAIAYRQRYELGDLVWYDTDLDGIQDAGEPGVQGIDVALFSNSTCTGWSLATDTTDANGNYLFASLSPGTYCVGFSSIPTGWNITLQNQGADDTRDSDANPATGRIPNIVLTADDHDEDMGLYEVVVEEVAEEFVPEMGTLALLGSGLAGLAGYASLRRRTRQ